MHPSATTTEPAVLDQLRTVHQARADLDRRRRHLIRSALTAGHTWTDIAHALGDTELGAILDHLAATAVEQGSEGR
ncbi:MAG: hypothetical protein R2761_28760 [Acidimicrobiales bacterium]